MAKKHWRELGSVSKEKGRGYRAYGYRLLPDQSTLREPKRFTSEQEAWDWIASIKAENEVIERAIKSGQTTEVPTTVRKLMKQFFEHRIQLAQAQGKPKIETVQHQAQTVAQAVIPSLGDTELTTAVLSKALVDFQRQLNERISEKTGKKLSSSRKRHIMLPLSSALKWGVARGFVEASALRDVIVPTQARQKVRERAIPQSDSKKILGYLKKYGCQHSKGICALRWNLAYWHGTRQAETLGLTWANVNLTRLEFVANQQLKRRAWKHGCGIDHAKSTTLERVWNCGNVQGQYCPSRNGGGLFLVAGTKTDEALDIPIPMNPQMLELFIAHKKEQDREISSATTGKNPTADQSQKKFWEGDNHLVFLQARTLRPYGARHDFTLWEDLLKACGVETHWRIHDLRHTAATNLASLTNGNVPLIQKALRHKSVLTTHAYIDPAQQELRQLFELYGESTDALTSEPEDSEEEEAEQSA